MKIEYKPGALRRIRYMQATVDMLEGKAAPIAAAANSYLGDVEGIREQQGYKVASRRGARRPWGRHRVSIAAITPYAQRHEARHNTLLRLLSGGGYSG